MDAIERALEILGLKPDVTFEDVKQAYRDLVKVWHPDRFQNDSRVARMAEEKLKEINEAYQTLQGYKFNSRHKSRPSYPSSARPQPSQNQGRPQASQHGRTSPSSEASDVENPIPPVDSTSAIDIAALWRTITAIEGPGDDPTLPSERSWAPPANVVLPSNTLKLLRTALSIALVFFGIYGRNLFVNNVHVIMWMCIAFVLSIAIWPTFSADKKAAAKQAYSTANAEWQGVLKEWQREASSSAFTKKLEGLGKAYDKLMDIPKERQRRMAKLEADRVKLQRQKYLERFGIFNANIMGIGPSRSATLSAYGIKTAADVVHGNIIRIPGFGEALASELVSWRQMHERNFRFNPSDPMHRRDIDALDRELEIRRQALLSDLKQGPDILRRLSQEINNARLRLMPLLEQAWTSLMIAKAHRNALRIWGF